MESKPLVIPEDLKKVCPLCKGKKEITYDDYEGRILGSCYFCSGTGVVWALTLEQMAERIARLEAEVAALKAQVEWTLIDEEHLPKVGDEVLKAESGYVDSVDADNKDYDYASWRRYGYTHYRSTNAPVTGKAVRNEPGREGL